MARPKRIIRCARCGGAFQAIRRTSKFCSRRCRDAAAILPLDQMLWTRVNKSGGCWIIGGSPTSDGYGRVVSQSAGKRKPWRAHVLAWTLASGVEPSDDQPVCHTCDTPRCVRNDEPGVYVVNGVVYPRFGHLFLGTPGANALDRNSKGRAPRGSALTMAKLTEDDVREIRRRYASGHVTQRALGLAYGVSKAAIFYIIQRKTWAHID